MKYGDIAPKLFENGWRNMIPLTHAKGTYVKWGKVQHQPMTEATLNYFMTNYGNAPRVGLVHGACHGIVSVDIDIEDENSIRHVLDVARQHLPPTEFVRVGKAPKCLLLYRGLVKSKKPHPIEIFGSSGQIAAFGDHPKTNRPYRWMYGVSPMDASPNDLPLVTQAQVDMFLSCCIQKVKLRSSTGSPALWHRDEVAAAERKIGGFDACARQLQDVQLGKRYPVVLKITGYLINKGATPEEAAEFVDKWFPQELRDEEFKNVFAVALRAAKAADKKWSYDEWEMDDE